MGYWAEVAGIYIDSPGHEDGQRIPVFSGQPRPLGDIETIILHEARTAFPRRKVMRRVLFQAKDSTGILLIQRPGQLHPLPDPDISGDAEVTESKIPQYREARDGKGRIIGGLVEEVRHLSLECVYINTGNNRFRGVQYVPDTVKRYR